MTQQEQPTIEAAETSSEATPEEEVEEAPRLSLSEQIAALRQLGRDIDPSTGEDKDFYENLSASVNAQRAALAGFPRRRP